MTTKHKHGSATPHHPSKGHLRDDIAKKNPGRVFFIDSDLDIVIQPGQQSVNRCICQVRTDFGNDNMEYGTGWLAGPRLLVTAAHVVHQTGQPVSNPLSVTIIPALNGEGHEPYGQLTVHSDTIHLPVNDPVKGSPDDYAVIVLPKIQRIGSIPFKALGDEKLAGKNLHIAGYSGGRSIQLYNVGQFAVADSLLKYRITTEDGMSGSPMWVEDNDGNCISVGIHIADGSECGNAIRITPQVYAFIHRIEQQI